MPMVELPRRIGREADLTPLLDPLAEGEGIGQPVTDEAAYVWLDEELMKAGSLQHGEIDWAGAEQQAICLLADRGRDLRVLAHLLHCLQRDRDAVRFALSLNLLQHALSHWWEEAYPRPARQGSAWRSRLFTTMIRRATSLAAQLQGAKEAALRHCLDAVTGLRSPASEKGLPKEPLVDLEQALDRLVPVAHGGPLAVRGSSPPANGQDHSPEPEEASTEARVQSELLPGDVRGNRDVLLRVASDLTDQAPDNPLGYRLRRFAVWQAIDNPPPARNDGRTELAPVAADRAALYREAAQCGDGTLWSRLEHSLEVSPFWLEGHRLSADLACQLGREPCANAIREEAARFLERLPGLADCRFSDGTPFVDETTRAWLVGPALPGNASGGNADAWSRALVKAREHLAQDGLGVALEILDSGLADADSPREAAYWRLASADLLHSAGLEAMARQQYRALRSAIEGLGLAQWEPRLVERLDALCRQ
ncbi:type VI secretion system protein VasJ [Alkalispirillum mobile]|uniref:Type VI secretion system protein VasJ n=1 Tax=Alkalispirillum mobile TaxID=85925 RepID=A0A498C8C7_9GAMM|nr:type VI secretion system protein TssA [Alkalispirillum mobile]RLK51703.1 type VI secretion system protein VasJ [Alkalispirillum mobile]